LQLIGGQAHVRPKKFERFQVIDGGASHAKNRPVHSLILPKIGSGRSKIYIHLCAWHFLMQQIEI
ncbi:MAG TPA: hypothetical protein VNZ25_01790, partial [Candidatus Angelobacter sp.]|nr:hypothetical protein [Candidatus Angelobacter sp.]